MVNYPDVEYAPRGGVSIVELNNSREVWNRGFAKPFSGYWGNRMAIFKYSETYQSRITVTLQLAADHAFYEENRHAGLYISSCLFL